MTRQFLPQGSSNVLGWHVYGRWLIQDEEQWFRVYEEYVHLSCAEKYLRLVSGRRQQAKTAPEQKHEMGAGN